MVIEIEKVQESGFKGSLSVESFKRSVFGRFSDKYKQLKAVITTKIIKGAFHNSKILSNAEGN